MVRRAARRRRSARSTWVGRTLIQTATRVVARTVAQLQTSCEHGTSIKLRLKSKEACSKLDAQPSPVQGYRNWREISRLLSMLEDNPNIALDCVLLGPSRLDEYQLGKSAV
ncbi:Uncharacterized protein PBTT_04985 [Plasmodiophora brassicae]